VSHDTINGLLCIAALDAELAVSRNKKKLILRLTK